MDLKALKQQIQALKTGIAEAVQAKNRPQLKKLRRQVKRLKAETRRLASAKAPPSAPATEQAPPAA